MTESEQHLADVGGRAVDSIEMARDLRAWLAKQPWGRVAWP